jgi:hypothetical protein
MKQENPGKENSKGDKNVSPTTGSNQKYQPGSKKHVE